MDIHFELNGDQFVWSDEKAEANWRKHGVRFEEAEPEEELNYAN